MLCFSILKTLIRQKILFYSHQFQNQAITPRVFSTLALLVAVVNSFSHNIPRKQFCENRLCFSFAMYNYNIPNEMVHICRLIMVFVHNAELGSDDSNLCYRNSRPLHPPISDHRIVTYPLVSALSSKTSSTTFQASQSSSAGPKLNFHTHHSGHISAESPSRSGCPYSHPSSDQLRFGEEIR